MEQTLYQMTKYDLSGIDDITTEDEYNASLNYLYLIKKSVEKTINKCNYNKGKIDNIQLNKELITPRIISNSRKLESFINAMLDIDTDKLKTVVENSENIDEETKEAILKSIKTFEANEMREFHKEIKELEYLKENLAKKEYDLFNEIADEIMQINFTKTQVEDISRLING